jgi:hypothetical protein
LLTAEVGWSDGTEQEADVANGDVQILPSRVKRSLLLRLAESTGQAVQAQSDLEERTDDVIALTRSSDGWAASRRSW